MVAALSTLLLDSAVGVVVVGVVTAGDAVVRPRPGSNGGDDMFCKMQRQVWATLALPNDSDRRKMPK